MNDAYSLINAGLPSQVWEAIGLAIFFAAVVMLLYRWNRENEKFDSRTESSVPVPLIAAGLSLLALVLSVGWMIIYYGRLDPSGVESKGASPRSDSSSSKELPVLASDFLEDIRFSSDEMAPLKLYARVSRSVSKLKVVVDVAPKWTAQYQSPVTIEIKDFSDLLRGKSIELPLISSGGAESGLVYWGDRIEGNLAVAPVNRVRLAIIGQGPDQNIYFTALPGPRNQPIHVVRENDLDWIKEWRLHDATRARP